MTLMSEGLLLNAKYIKMAREEGGLTQLPLVIVCHELIIWRLFTFSKISARKRLPKILGDVFRVKIR